MKRTVIYIMLCLGFMVLASCGGGGGGGTTTPGGDTSGDTTSVSGVVVDPYIQGAVFCIDENANQECDEGEPTSTASNASGQFTFSEEPADGALIVMKTNGTHNGVPYGLNDLMGVYEGGDIVVSPLTTVYAAGLTADQIVEMLAFAGLADVTADTVFTDPMNGLYSGDTISTANLAVLRSTLASYMLIRIIEGSDTLSSMTAQEVYTSAMDANGAVYQILSTMAGYLNQALSQNTLTMIQPYDDMLVGYGMQAVSFSDVVSSAVAIADKLSEIGFTTCNATNGDYAAAIAAVNTYATTTTNFTAMVAQLGPAYYLNRIKTQMSAAVQAGVGSYSATYGTYLNCSSGAFVLGDDGNISCYQ